MRTPHKTLESIADSLGFDFLEKIFSAYKTDDKVGKLASSVGYKRDRAVELMNNPEKLRIIDMVKIADRSGFDVQISLIKKNKE